MKQIFYCALFLLTARPLSATGLSIQVDTAQTTIAFSLGGTLHTVHGTFKVKSGLIHFDPDTGSANGEIVIDVRSGNTGNETRDRKMHKDVLESQSYPDALFAPDRVIGSLAPQGESDIQVHGFFTIHGAKHEVTIPAKVQMQNGSIDGTAHFTIPYVSWGMKNPSTFVLRVSEKVDVDIHLKGLVQH